MNKISPMLLAALVASGALNLNRAVAANGTWVNASGGSWTNTANWSGGIIAGGVDAIANFSTINITANRTVTLDGDVTIGHLLAGDASSGQEDYILAPGAGGALILAVSSGMPTFELALTRNNDSFVFNIDSDLQGTQGVLIIGDNDGNSGRFQYRAVPKTYGGNTILTNGAKLRLDNSLGDLGGIPDGPGKGDLYIWNGPAGALTRFIINQVNETVNGLWGNGQIDKDNAVITTLTVGNNDASSEFRGVLNDGANAAFNIRKIGAGTFTFNGAANGTYTGALIADGGTVVVGPDALIPPGSTLAAGAGLLNLSSANLPGTTGYSIGGNGPVILGPLTLSGITLNPGLASTPGTLILSNSVTCTATATNVFDLAMDTTVGNGVNDLLIINGNLDFASLTLPIRFRFLEALPSTNGQYTIIKYTGSLLNGSVANLAAEIPSFMTARFDNSVPNEIRVSFNYTLSNRDLVWNTPFFGFWDEGLNTAWLQGASQVAFASGDRAWFTNEVVMAATNQVEVSQVLFPGGVTVGGTNDYLFTGSGYLVGGMDLSKNGTGSLIISNANKYNGTTYINSGTVRVYSGSALGQTNGPTIIAPGATLDLNAVIGAEPIFVAGNGVGGLGAITRTLTNLVDDSARNITLTGDATFSVLADRWDIQAKTETDPVLKGAGFRLTKIGTNVFGIAGVASSTNAIIDTDLGDLEIVEGVQLFGWGVTLGRPDRSIFVRSNATLRLNKTGVINNSATNILVKNLFMTNATINPQSSGGTIDLPVFFGGPIEVNGECVFQTGNTLGNYFYGPISGPGSIRKTGGQSAVFTASNSFAGPLIITQNKVTLANSSGPCLATSSIVMEATNGNAFLEIQAHEQIADTALLTFTNAVAGDCRFALKGFNETIAGLQGNRGSGAGEAYVQAGVGDDGDSNLVSTLTLLVRGGDTFDFGGVVRDFASPATNCLLNLVKEGPGTQVLSGAATYTGTTTVRDGTLAFNGSAAEGSAIVLQGGMLQFGGPTALRTRTNTITGSGSLVKDGDASVDLRGAATFTGATVIKAGRLAINNSFGSGAGSVSVQGGTLAGSGTIADPVTVLSGGFLAPGNSSGSLRIGSLVLQDGSTTVMELDKFSPVIEIPDQVIGLSSVRYGGTLQVVDLTTAFPITLGDEFQLFSSATYSGSFTNIILPALAAGLGWSNSLSTEGFLRVVQSSSLAPTNLSWSFGSAQLTLAWPAAYTGWFLQAQTNQLSAGLGSNWVTVPGSDQTNTVTIPVNPANPAVFYRMTLQP